MTCIYLLSNFNRLKMISMKANYWRIAVFIFLSFNTIVIKAQSEKISSDQFELMKSTLGTWQTIVGKDTIEKWEHQLYGKGFIVTAFQVAGAKSIPQHVNIFSYDPGSNNFKGFMLWHRGVFATWIGAFTNEKVFHIEFVTDLIPEKAWGSFDMIFEDSSVRKHVHYVNGKKTHEEIFKKVK